MIRETELISYLPPFMRSFKEIGASLGAEDPEFWLLWQQSDRVLKNNFIYTADEYGISRFEKLLGIYPSENDTLEERRKRVAIQWLNLLPYTTRTLEMLLTDICGSGNFEVIDDYHNYSITVMISVAGKSKYDESVRLLQRIIPCNMSLKCFIKYNTHSVVHRFTHGYARKYKHTELRNEVLI